MRQRLCAVVFGVFVSVVVGSLVLFGLLHGRG